MLADPGVRAMGVRVRRHKGTYYLFLNLGGRRKAIKVGTDKRVANSAAAKLRKAIARGFQAHVGIDAKG